MVPGIHNFSEIGKLNKVLLHRIGHEIDGLVPDNFARLLFDDIPFLEIAQQEHDAFAQALRTRCYEPDPPNYTPRISGLMHKDGSFALSILKSADGDPACSHRFFYGYDNPLPGEGRFIHTYQENADPLPSFEGEPRRVAITAPDAATLAKELWDNLNADNKVSLFVRYVNLESGDTHDVIINKHG